MMAYRIANRSSVFVVESLAALPRPLKSEVEIAFDTLEQDPRNNYYPYVDYGPNRRRIEVAGKVKILFDIDDASQTVTIVSVARARWNGIKKILEKIFDLFHP